MVKMILFDVDGVILKEERYFDASALTVWELIHSPNYLGINEEIFTSAPDESTIRKVRKTVFDKDHSLHIIKNRGINANWDMVYLTFSSQLILFLQKLAKTKQEKVAHFLQNNIGRAVLKEIGKELDGLNVKPDFSVLAADIEKTSATKQELLTYLNQVAEEKTGVSTSIFSRNSHLWDVCQEAFQEWYLGEERLDPPLIQPGKKGFLADEIPIIPPEDLKKLFNMLQTKGITLGLGTGRPEIETVEPLKALGLIDYFEEKRRITAKDVLETERQFPEEAPLSKPQPFTYVYGWLGKDHSAREAMNTPLPLGNSEQLLIVGDSPADYYAAKSIGAQFAVVLTGLPGQKARKQFEQLGADYILNDVTEVKNLI